MARTPDRRSFLRSVGGCGVLLAAGLAGLRPARGQTKASELSVTELRDGLVLIGGAGGNIVVLDGADGLGLVDSGAAEHAEALRSLLAERFAKPVEVLLNTHWHLDHTGGNDLLAEAAPTIVAHENTRLWMSTELYVDWEERTYPSRRAEALPTSTFFSSDPQPLELDVGGRRVVYAHLKQAHTDGDIYVHFPESNVIASGGVVTAGAYPLIDYVTGGWIGGTVEATQRLIELCDDDTLIVPDRGPPQRRAQLEAQVEMLSTIRERVEELAVEGKGAREMLEAGITRDFDETWSGDARLFLMIVYEGLWWGGRMRGIVA